MSTILIKNGYLVRESVKQSDIFIKDGIISRIGSRIDRSADIEINAEGKYVFCGFADMHTHLREPGGEHKETIKSGATAAVKGGFTDVFAMPNTQPANDSNVVTEFILRRAEKADMATVHPIGAITKGLQGKELSEMGRMKECGVSVVSDDGMPVSDGGIMRKAMEYADGLGLVIVSHSEDKTISAGGSVNEGVNSVEAGLPGISRAAEEVGIARDLILAETLDIPIHICHVSTAGGAELIRFFKKKGVRVTAETCPHYFALNDKCIMEYNTATKVNPPIRTEDDRIAIINAIKDGTIDVIATDHAPHSFEDKNVEYNYATFGISGIETAFALSYSCLVESGIIDIVKLNELLSANPRKITKIGGRLKEGERADITIADIDKSYKIDSANFVSKGKNTPFNGVTVKGVITDVIVNGNVKLSDGEIV